MPPSDNSHARPGMLGRSSVVSGASSRKGTKRKDTVCLDLCLYMHDMYDMNYMYDMYGNEWHA
jgi:hypothetical protein